MRDVGVFTSESVSTEQLIELVRSYCLRANQPLERRQGESVVGRPPDVLYVSEATAPSNGYFSEEEKQTIESKLGSTAEGYVSIHFTSTDAAFKLADELAHELSRKCSGIVDYSGTGGGLGLAPANVEPGATDS